MYSMYENIRNQEARAAEMSTLRNKNETQVRRDLDLTIGALREVARHLDYNMNDNTVLYLRGFVQRTLNTVVDS